jgi:hypothetical protein
LLFTFKLQVQDCKFHHFTRTSMEYSLTNVII